MVKNGINEKNYQFLLNKSNVNEENAKEYIKGLDFYKNSCNRPSNIYLYPIIKMLNQNKLPIEFLMKTMDTKAIGYSGFTFDLFQLNYGYKKIFNLKQLESLVIRLNINKSPSRPHFVLSNALLYRTRNFSTSNIPKLSQPRIHSFSIYNLLMSAVLYNVLNKTGASRIPKSDTLNFKISQNIILNKIDENLKNMFFIEKSNDYKNSESDRAIDELLINLQIKTIRHDYESLTEEDKEYLLNFANRYKGELINE